MLRSIAVGDAIKTIPYYTEFTVCTTFRANYIENKMKGETDKQAATAAAGDTVIDEVSSNANGKIDNKLQVVPGTASLVTDNFSKSAKEGWNKFVLLK